MAAKLSSMEIQSIELQDTFNLNNHPDTDRDQRSIFPSWSWCPKYILNAEF